MRYSVGFIARNQKLFQYSDRDAQEYTLAAVRTLLSAQPELFEKMIATDSLLSTSGYDADKDVGKIPVVDKNGDIVVRRVHLLSEEDDDGNRALVLRGAVGQIVASISQSELKDFFDVQVAQIEKNKTDIAALQEIISGVADALDAI